MPPTSKVRAGRAFDRGGATLTLDLFAIEMRLKLCGPEVVPDRSSCLQPAAALRRAAPVVLLPQGGPLCERGAPGPAGGRHTPS